MAGKLKFNPFGRKAISYGLIHDLTFDEELVCGDRSQYGPTLNVDDSEPTTCLSCLTSHLSHDGASSGSSKRT